MLTDSLLNAAGWRPKTGFEGPFGTSPELVQQGSTNSPQCHKGPPLLALPWSKPLLNMQSRVTGRFCLSVVRPSVWLSVCLCLSVSLSVCLPVSACLPAALHALHDIAATADSRLTTATMPLFWIVSIAFWAWGIISLTLQCIVKPLVASSPAPASVHRLHQLLSLPAC